MGLFDRIFSENNSNGTQDQMYQADSSKEKKEDTPLEEIVKPKREGILNLKKNQVLNLSKNLTLNRIRAAAGWDVNSNSFFSGEYDLDLCAFLLDRNGKFITKIFFNHKTYDGIFLDKDNLTGKGSGDDENIYVTLDEIPSEVCHIIFGVVIYQGRERRQKFRNVSNAYVRLVDTDRNKTEICRYNLSENGEDNTAVIAAKLFRDGGEWKFQTIGEFSQDSITSLNRKVSKYC